MRIIIALLISVLVTGCISNPTNSDISGPERSAFYGSKATGILKDSRSAQVALVKINDEREVIQMDVTRPRYLPPGKHNVKIGVSVIDRTSFVTFPFLAEAGKSYHFTGREVQEGFEVTAYEGKPQEGAVVFRAHVPFGRDVAYTFIDMPS